MMMGFIRGFAVAKFLGPSLYGIRNTYSIIMEYHGFSHLGTLFAMNRLVPFYRGKNDYEKARLIVSTAFWVNMLPVFLIGLSISILPLCFRSNVLSSSYKELFLFTGALIITTRIVAFYITKLKLENRFYLLSVIDVISKLTGIAACIILTYYLSLSGFFIGLLIGDAIFILAVLRKKEKIPSFFISFKVIKELLKLGAPIMLGGVLMMVLFNVDKIMILFLLSEKALGFYSIAGIATGIVGTIPTAIYSVTLPHLMLEYGESSSIANTYRYFEEPTMIMAYLFPFLLGSIFFSIHIPILYFLSKFTPSIGIVKILALAVFFASVPRMGISICYTINKQLNVVYLIIPCVLINAVLSFTILTQGIGLEGVAIGAGVSYFIFSTLLLLFVLKQYGRSIKERVKFLIKIYAPLFYAIFIILVIEIFMIFNARSFWNDIHYTLIKIFLFYLIYSVILIFIRKDRSFIKLIEQLKYFIKLIFKESILNR
jgi:O-antigen/teichoic acid export membrane protein